MASVPMPNSEEYELVPRAQIEYLRREVEQIKRNPFGDTKSSKDLLSAIDKLNQNVERLVQILETANDEIVRDYKDRSNAEKMNKLMEQNEKLAKGIVTVADLVKQKSDAQAAAFASPEPRQAPPQMPSAAPPAWPSQQNPFLDNMPIGTPPEQKPRLNISDIPPPP